MFGGPSHRGLVPQSRSKNKDLFIYLFSTFITHRFFNRYSTKNNMGPSERFILSKENLVHYELKMDLVHSNSQLTMLQ